MTTYMSQTGYSKHCNKCLVELSEEQKLKYGKFCSKHCKKDYYLECKQDIDDVNSEFFDS